MQYVYRASQTSETTSATITGLTAGARYAVLVTALDEAGKKLGVYEYRSFYTEDNGGWEPGPTDSDVSDDPTCPARMAETVMTEVAAPRPARPSAVSRQLWYWGCWRPARLCVCALNTKR